jgi:hypothetical protein
MTESIDREKLDAALKRQERGFYSLDETHGADCLAAQDSRMIFEAARAWNARTNDGGAVNVGSGRVLDTESSAISAPNEGSTPSPYTIPQSPPEPGDIEDALEDLTYWAQVGLRTAPRGKTIPSVEYLEKVIRAALSDTITKADSK